MSKFPDSQAHTVESCLEKEKKSKVTELEFSLVVEHFCSMLEG